MVYKIKESSCGYLKLKGREKKKQAQVN